jgi:hypothetical protein
MPPLLRNLAGLGDQGKLSERLRARFPIGSPEADLIRELWLEGFQPATDLRASKREAKFDRHADFPHDICHRVGSVYWTADEHGRLTEVSGRFSMTCP